MVEIVCPISDVKINRNVVRVTGFLTTLLLLAYAMTGFAPLIIFIAVDYMGRTVLRAPPFVVARAGGAVVRMLRLPNREMDKAAKVFASRIGFGFAVGATIAHFVAPPLAVPIALALAAFTTLESIFDFCVGCVVYTYIALPLRRRVDPSMGPSRIELGE